MKKLYDLGATAILIIFGCLLSFMGLKSFDYISEINNIFIIKFLKLIVCIGLFILVYLGIYRLNFSNQLASLGLFLSAFFLRFLFILNVDIQPISDFKLLYETAYAISNGNLEPIKNDVYFKLWNYNIPFTLYEAFILRIFDNQFVIQFVNVLLSSGIVVLIYNISRKLFNQKIGLFSAIIAIVFPPFIVYSGILTNQTISIFFLLLGIYFYLSKKDLIWVGLMLGLAQIFRPIGTLFLLGIVLMLLIQFISNNRFNFNSIKSLIIKNIKLFSSYHLVLIITSVILLKGNYSEHSLYHNASSNYKFLVGFNYNSKGGYSEEDSNLLFNTYDTTFENYSKELIKIRTEDKLKVLELFEEKFRIMWSSSDSSFYWADWYNDQLLKVTNYMWVVILFLGSYASFSLIKSISRQHVLMIPILLGLFIGVYFLIEIQSRYRYELYPLFIIISGYGMFEMFQFLYKKVRVK